MKIEIKQVGKSWSSPAMYIELIVEDNNSRITSEITNLKGLVDIELIHSLRQIADALEEQNTLVNETK